MFTVQKKSSPSQTTRSISRQIHEQASRVIPGGVNSPVRAFKSLGISPLVVSHGRGDTIVDVDGNSYIDYCGSWGALIHGHAHPDITRAALLQIQKGSTFGILTEVEKKMAEKIVTRVPSIEKIRFVSSGTEATMSAIRCARGFTGRDQIIKFSGHYHGHADHLLVQSGSGVSLLPKASSLGVPEDFVKNTICIPFNDFDALKKVMSKKVAAIICEPVAANMGLVPPQRAFLEFLREETNKQGALLIFDEVITGFRIGLQGAQGHYGIVPDLTCFGKIVGGGFPAAAFGGRKAIMDYLAPLGGVYQAGTLSGNPVAMEAGLTALQLLEEKDFYETLLKKTKSLTEPLQECIREHKLNVCLQEVGSMFTLFFGIKEVRNFEEAKSADHSLFNQFFHYLFERGIYFSPLQCEANFISMAHTEENINYTRDVILEFLEMSCSYLK